MRKIFGFKSITTLLYGLLMLLPMFSILSRVIYVQSNQNAFESYYGENINIIQYEKINNLNEIKINNRYLVQNVVLTNSLGRYEGSITNGLLFDLIEIKSNNTGLDLTNVNKITYLTSETGTTVATRFYDDNTLIGYSYEKYEFIITYISNDVESQNVASYNSILVNSEAILLEKYVKDSYLDNAFDYSLKTFVDDNNYGFNFFSWFGDMFLNQSGNNMIYLNFINWYLNYGLLISVAYIFFLILLWFINLSRRILDRLMNLDGGGY